MNTEQQNAAIHASGKSLVCAAAGSGKTRCIAERALRLCHLGESVLTLAYNTDAAEEIRKRAEHPLHRVQTFHAFCLSQLGLRVCPDRVLIAQIRQKTGNRMTWEQASEIVNLWGYQAETLATEHTNLDLKKSLEYSGYTFFQLIRGYSNLCKAHPDKLASQWASWHIQADEIQDATPARWLILDTISRDAKSFLAVGDPRQSIYSFQGAMPKLFVSRWESEQYQNLSLPHNFRSCPEIVELANRIVAKYRWAIGGPSIAVREEKGSTKKVQRVDAESGEKRNAQVLYRLNRHSDQIGGRTIHSAKGLEWPNVLVLENDLPHCMGDKEEEERIRYVAYTRARDNLYIGRFDTGEREPRNGFGAAYEDKESRYQSGSLSHFDYLMRGLK